MATFVEALAAKRRLENGIAVLEALKEQHIRDANYDEAAKTRDRLLELYPRRGEYKDLQVSVGEVEEVLTFLRVLASKVQLGDLLKVLMDERFKNLLPVTEHALGPHLKFSDT